MTNFITTEPHTTLVSDPHGVRYQTDSTERSGRIVVGLDGSPSSIAALAGGIRLASALNAHLEIIATWAYPAEFQAIPTPDAWSPEEDAIEILGAASRHAFPAGLPEWAVLRPEQGRPAAALIEASAGAEMLIVGSRGRSALKGLLLGSVSTECAEHASCPVLVVH
jgi:nucleotide-binding universal stress UspA family protein